MICKMIFFSEFPDIIDNAGRKTRRKKRRRAQAIAKYYTFQANAKIDLLNIFFSTNYI